LVALVEGLRGIGLTQVSMRSKLDIVRTVLIARLKIIMRYRGAWIFETFMPVVFAAMPILLGIAVGGANAAENFKANTGTENFKLYMLLGACTFMIVMFMMWLVGYWIRREQETGTIESLYLTPAKRIHIVTGVTTYALIRALVTFVASLLIGSLVFQIDIFRGDLLIAAGFIIIGIIPLWGISFAFGALILKIKEANSVIQMMTWIVAFFMGVYFPIAVFPPLFRYIAMAFPPTWMTNGVRASLLDISYFFGTWYFDIAILFAFAAVFPLIGYATFLTTEKRLKKREGVGHY